jgi:hypothetical protein
MSMNLLKEKDIYPSSLFLEQALGKVYVIYDLFIQTIQSSPYHLSVEWRYYFDGKAWLCKVTNKKKTICWISVWDKFFKISFYFAEKYRKEIELLCISIDNREEIKRSKVVGKLLPLIVEVKEEKQLKDILTIVDFKIKIK